VILTTLILTNALLQNELASGESSIDRASNSTKDYTVFKNNPFGIYLEYPLRWGSAYMNHHQSCTESFYLCVEFFPKSGASSINLVNLTETIYPTPAYEQFRSKSCNMETLELYVTNYTALKEYYKSYINFTNYFNYYTNKFWQSHSNDMNNSIANNLSGARRELNSLREDEPNPLLLPRNLSLLKQSEAGYRVNIANRSALEYIPPENSNLCDNVIISINNGDYVYFVTYSLESAETNPRYKSTVNTIIDSLVLSVPENGNKSRYINLDQGKIRNNQSGEVNELINRGNAFYKVGSFDKAILYYDMALGVEPKSAVALNNYGLVFENQSEHEKAILYYDKALDSNPFFFNALYNKGLSLLNSAYDLESEDSLEFESESILYFDMALMINPNSVEALNNFAAAKLAYGIDQQIESVMSYMSLAETLLNSTNTSNSSRPYDSDLFEWPGVKNGSYSEPEVGVKLVFAADFNSLPAGSASGNPLDNKTTEENKQIIKICDIALAISPGDTEVLVNKGKALILLQSYDKAVQTLKNVLAIKPDLGTANYQMGKALEGLGKTEIAKKFFDICKKQNENCEEEDSTKGGILASPT